MVAEFIIENQYIVFYLLCIILLLTLFDVYLRILGVLSLGYAALPQIVVIKVISDVFGDSVIRHHIEIRPNPF